MWRRLVGAHWAQPVVSRPWAAVSTVLFAASQLSGYRMLNGAKGTAWNRAVGNGPA